MKAGGLKNKKAVSAVVATVLIIMITLAAVGIIWVTLLPMIKDNLGSSDSCKEVGISIISSQGYTCYKPNNITMVQVSKGSTKVNVTGLTFSVSLEGNSYDYNNQKVAYSTAEYNVYYLNTSEFAKIEKISVVPIITLGNSEKSCSVISLEDIPLCSSSVNLVAVSAGKLIGRSGSATLDNGETPCDNSCSCADGKLVGESCINGCENICYGTKRDGSILAPFAIYNWTDLNNTRNNLAANYILMNNLSLSDGDYTGIGNNWQPIGDCGPDSDCIATEDNSLFSGNFNGRGNIISNLSIAGVNYVGLFGNSSGNISNVQVTIQSITGDSGGCLVGYNTGVISNSSTILLGTLSVYDNAGGLVGYNLGNISNSFAIISGAITSSNYYSGGLVGENKNSGTVSNSYVAVQHEGLISSVKCSGGVIGRNMGLISNSSANIFGKVSASSEAAGGLVGKNEGGNISTSNILLSGAVSANYYAGGLVGQTVVSGSIFGLISNSSANISGNVSASFEYAGGLVGINSRNNISNCYVLLSGNISANNQYAGGLVGYSGVYGSFNNSYILSETTGSILTPTYAGGFAGSKSASSLIKNCYAVRKGTGYYGDGVGAGFLGSGSGVTSSFYDESVFSQDIGGAVPKTTTEMKIDSTFTAVGWDFTNIWSIDAGGVKNNGYPYLKWQAL